MRLVLVFLVGALCGAAVTWFALTNREIGVSHLADQLQDLDLEESAQLADELGRRYDEIPPDLEEAPPGDAPSRRE